jgi:hypothetical protein
MRKLLLVAATAMLLAIGLTALHRSPALAQNSDIVQMVANAKTAADHEAIAQYYDREAASAKANAALHRSQAETYEKLRIKPPDMIHHCREIAKDFDRIAREADDLAVAHRAMAKAAK